MERATQEYRAVLAPTQTTGDWVPLDIPVPPVMENMEHTVAVPVPQIAARISEVVETIPQERIWCTFEEFDDFPVPQIVEENLDVIKAPHGADNRGAGAA